MAVIVINWKISRLNKRNNNRFLEKNRFIKTLVIYKMWNNSIKLILKLNKPNKTMPLKQNYKNCLMRSRKSHQASNSAPVVKIHQLWLKKKMLVAALLQIGYLLLGRRSILNKPTITSTKTKPIKGSEISIESNSWMCHRVWLAKGFKNHRKPIKDMPDAEVICKCTMLINWMIIFKRIIMTSRTCHILLYQVTMIL